MQVDQKDYAVVVQELNTVGIKVRKLGKKVSLFITNFPKSLTTTEVQEILQDCFPKHDEIYPFPNHQNPILTRGTAKVSYLEEVWESESLTELRSNVDAAPNFKIHPPQLKCLPPLYVHKWIPKLNFQKEEFKVQQSAQAQVQAMNQQIVGKEQVKAKTSPQQPSSQIVKQTNQTDLIQKKRALQQMTQKLGEITLETKLMNQNYN